MKTSDPRYWRNWAAPLSEVQPDDMPDGYKATWANDKEYWVYLPAGPAWELEASDPLDWDLWEYWRGCWGCP